MHFGTVATLVWDRSVIEVTGYILDSQALNLIKGRICLFTTESTEVLGHTEPLFSGTKGSSFPWSKATEV